MADKSRCKAGEDEHLAEIERAVVEVNGRSYPVTLYRDLDSKWLVGRCTAIRGCVTQGETREELLEMLADAITECLLTNGDEAI